MMPSKNKHDRADQRSQQRAPWTTPRVTRMEAGSAEAGPNDVTNEGQFGFGDS